MKNKKILALLVAVLGISTTFAGCNFFNSTPSKKEVAKEQKDKKEKSILPTEAPKKEQSVNFVNKAEDIAITLPNNSWINKTDDKDVTSFESQKEGKLVILKANGPEQMSTVIIPSSEDITKTLVKASGLEENKDFTISDYGATNVDGVNVYSYIVHLTSDKGKGYKLIYNKVFSTENSYISIEASLKDEKLLPQVVNSINTFKILGNSELAKATANVQLPGTQPKKDEQKPNQQPTEQAKQEQKSDTKGQNLPQQGVKNGGFSEAQLNDTNQTRTIYDNSNNGKAIVIVPSGDGNWQDRDGNKYHFTDDQTAYDQNEKDYYYHGEPASVYYMSSDDSSN